VHTIDIEKVREVTKADGGVFKTTLNGVKVELKHGEDFYFGMRETL
jgi:hypothetical protein